MKKNYAHSKQWLQAVQYSTISETVKLILNICDCVYTKNWAKLPIMPELSFSLQDLQRKPNNLLQRAQPISHGK